MNLLIEKLVYGGDGLSRADGQVIFTPFAGAGEDVSVELEPVRSGTQRARLVEVLQPSPQRVPPPCPYFGHCGGCHYQHLDYAAQLEAKRGILIETMRRVGKIESLPEIETIAGAPYHYRNRVQLHIEDRKLGYRESRSHKLCAIDHCPISSPKINACIAALSKMVTERRWPKFVESIELFTDESGVQLNVLEASQPVARRFFDWCAEVLPGFVESSLEYRVGEYLYRVSGGSFFQVNRFLLEPMVQAAIGTAAGESALDIYAGVGLFSLPLAKRFAKVTAVESGAGATRDLTFNAARSSLQVRIETLQVEEYLRGVLLAPDLVLADPPRAGLGKFVVNKFLEILPPRIHVVSCDPATLARDLGPLLTNGYKLERLILLDLFPQTFHMETIAHLVLL